MSDSDRTVAAASVPQQQHASTPNTNWQMCGELLLPNDGDDSEEWISGAETYRDGLLGCLRRRRCSRVLQRFSWTGKSHGGGGCLAVLSHAGRGRRLACGAHGPGRLADAGCTQGLKATYIGRRTERTSRWCSSASLPLMVGHTWHGSGRHL